MKFEEALSKLREGNKIKMKTWVDSYIYKDQVDQKYYKKDASLFNLPLGLDLKLALDSEWELVDQNQKRFVLFLNLKTASPEVSTSKFLNKDEFFAFFKGVEVKFVKFIEDFEINDI